MQSSIAGISVAGDVAGIEEASSAMEEGRLAGISAAVSLGKIGEKLGAETMEEARRRLRALRLGPYGDNRQESKESLIQHYHAVQ